MLRKGYILIVLAVFGSTLGFAQQQPLYSQYMLNTYLVNPAVAGAEGLTAFNLTARKQWAGYVEGPSTYAVSAQTRILKTSFRNRSRLIKARVRKRRPSGKVGLGGFIYNDQNGRIRRTGLQGTYAYHIYMRDYQLSLGASVSFYQFSINVTQADMYDYEKGINDPLIGKNQKISPDANVGALISNEKFYAGISSTSLFQSSIQFGNGNPNDAYRILRQYYLIGGYRIEPYRSAFAIEPSILFTTNERFQRSMDLNVKGYYKQDYWVGVSFRTTGAVVMMFGARYQKFTFGYAFDQSFNDASTLSKFGSHEFMIGYKLGDTVRRYRWLNRF
ncbi:MAG: type IX secretion system membrane protein PorP/SprF [Bacteroidales bacterium]|nr:MAG: type IX secretion system membrane protein PorP/SprF [Bacteroidales bacterium]